MNLIRFKNSTKDKIPELPERIKFSRLRLLGIAVLGMLSSVILLTVFFVYDTLNSAIGQIESISGLQSDLVIEPIDFNKLENVKKRWEEKHNSSYSLSKDPFNTVNTPSSTNSSTPAKS